MIQDYPGIGHLFAKGHLFVTGYMCATGYLIATRYRAGYSRTDIMATHFSGRLFSSGENR